MTRSQQLNFELQQASTEAEVLAIWTRYRDLLVNASLILSVPGSCPFSVAMPKSFGTKARLISPFAYDDLIFLNDHIYSEMTANRECSFKIMHSISFDTNAASYLRRLFAGLDTAVYHDLRMLLLHFLPHRLNWQVVPYLMENAEAIASGKNGQAIFETIMAAEKLGIVDMEHLRLNGEIRVQTGEPDTTSRAAKRLSDVARHFTGGTKETILKRWEAMYVTVLFMALEQIKKPERERARDKLKSTIKFMDEHLHAVFAEMLLMAWDWFNRGKQTHIFNRLQKNAPELVSKAQNISWDVFHLEQMRQEITFMKSTDSFLVPFFLTFDQGLADLVAFSAIKISLSDGTFQYPVCFPNQHPDALLLPALENDGTFLEHYLTSTANQRRMGWIKQNGWPELSALRGALEAELVRYQSPT